MKKVVILGAGGHGLLALRNLFEQSDLQFNVFYNTSDWGGSYGLFGRLMEFSGGQLNKELHNGEKVPLLPFADPNKLVGFYLKNIDSKAAEALDFRAYNQEDFEPKIEELFRFFGLNKNQRAAFRNYFQTFWHYYQSNKERIKYKAKINLGYIFHFFIYSRSQKLSSWVEFFKSKGCVPQSMNINFSYQHRQTLVAQDISLVKIHGEDKIDRHKNPILPETLTLITDDQRENQVSKSLLSDLIDSEAVIFPNGSVCNWLPLVNVPKVKEILKEKKLIWITNPYRTKNELINPNYQLYLNESKLFPTIISQKGGTHNEGFLNILDQDKTGRYFPEQLSEEILKII